MTDGSLSCIIEEIRSNGQNQKLAGSKATSSCCSTLGCGCSCTPRGVTQPAVKLMGWHQADLPGDLSSRRWHGLSMAFTPSSFFNPYVEIFWMLLYVCTSETRISLQNKLRRTQIRKWSISRYQSPPRKFNHIPSQWSQNPSPHHFPFFNNFIVP